MTKNDRLLIHLSLELEFPRKEATEPIDIEGLLREAEIPRDSSDQSYEAAKRLIYQLNLEARDYERAILIAEEYVRI